MCHVTCGYWRVHIALKKDQYKEDWKKDNVTPAQTNYSRCANLTNYSFVNTASSSDVRSYTFAAPSGFEGEGDGAALDAAEAPCGQRHGW